MARGVVAAGTHPGLGARGTPGADPAAFFGYRPGEDGRLASWGEICAFLRALAGDSPRVRLLELGATLEGRPLLALAVAEPAVLARLDTLAAAQTALAARPGTVAGAGADVPVVLVTCGVHAPEAAAPQGAAALAAELALREDAIAGAIRERVLLLLVPAVDPDGLERMQAWSAWSRGRPAAGLPPPGLYRRYAEHDINRDWIMQTQPEVLALAAGLHHRFLPHVHLDLHEMWTHGPRMFLPPYARPADPAADPEVIARADDLGRDIAARLTAQGLAGIATGVLFDAYSPARGYAHHHGGVRILCEAAGAGLAAALHIPAERLRPSAGFDPRIASERQPVPWPGGVWSTADVMRYQRAAVWAALQAVAGDPRGWLEWQRRVLGRAADPGLRPGAYLLPARQRDPGAARELRRVLAAGGLHALDLPDGGTAVPRAQAFGTWADALLHPQPYPGRPAGEPMVAPYDVTAHLLPGLMGVRCEALPHLPPAAEGTSAAGPAPAPPGCEVWPAADSDSFRAVFVALGAGRPVWQVEPGPGAEGLPEGGAFVSGRQRDLPGSWRAVARRLQAPRVAVYGSWRSGSDEGWLRYVLDRFGLPYSVLRDSHVQRGAFGGCTHLVLPALRGRDLMHGLPADRYPAAYAGGLGERGRRQIRDFVAGGGRLLAVEGAAAWTQAALDLPLQDLTLPLGARIYAPGALLPIIPGSGPLGFGAGPRTHVLYRGGPAFQATPEIVAAAFSAEPPAAGLAEGTGRLAGAAAVADVPHQGGRCLLYAFSPYFRAQAWASFRWLFNGMLA